jgi:hypothetical protein
VEDSVFYASFFGPIVCGVVGAGLALRGHPSKLRRLAGVGMFALAVAVVGGWIYVTEAECTEDYVSCNWVMWPLVISGWAATLLLGVVPVVLGLRRRQRSNSATTVG